METKLKSTAAKTMSRAAAFLAGLGFVGAVGAAQAQGLDVDALATYKSSLDQAPVSLATIVIKTCPATISKDAGTNGGVSISIDGKSGEYETYYLDAPGSDRTPGKSEEYSFKFPKGRIGELKGFSLYNESGDDWCISSVALYVSGEPIMTYDADKPLANDTIFPGLDGPNHSGKGPIWLSDTGHFKITFSDEWRNQTLTPNPNPTTPVPLALQKLAARGPIKISGYLGLPLRRSAQWKYVQSHYVDGKRAFAPCNLPSLVTKDDFDIEFMTEVGDRMGEDSKLYWGSGNTQVTTKVTGAHPVFGARATFRGKAPLKDANVTLTTTITPWCGVDQSKGNGMRFIVAKPNVDIDLSVGTQFVRGLLDVFTFGYTDKFFRTTPSVAAPGSTFTKLPKCPSFGTDKNGDLTMKWPATVKLSDLQLSSATLSAVEKASFGLIGPNTPVNVPQNALCIDMSSLKAK